MYSNVPSADFLSAGYFLLLCKEKPLIGPYEGFLEGAETFLYPLHGPERTDTENRYTVNVDLLFVSADIDNMVAELAEPGAGFDENSDGGGSVKDINEAEIIGIKGDIGCNFR